VAVTTIVHCDKYGSRVTQDRTTLKPTVGPLRHREPVDLCSDCSAALLEWLGPVPGRKPAGDAGTIVPVALDGAARRGR